MFFCQQTGGSWSLIAGIPYLTTRRTKTCSRKQLGVVRPQHLAMQSCLDLPELTLNLSDDHANVFKLLEKIKPEWKKDQVHIKNLSGGYSCCVLRCKHQSGESVTVRVRNNLDDGRDPAFEREVAKVMSAKGYFPPLLAMFQNGFCYDYIPGRPVYMKGSDQIGVDEEQLRLIAQGMANIHSVVVPGLDYKRSTLFEHIVGVLASAKPRFEGCPTIDELIDEVRLVEEFVSAARSPLVTIHADAHTSNMIWDAEQRKISYVDWEVAQVGQRAFDIAYFIYAFEFLANFVKISVKKPHDIERKFCVHYLERWNELSNKPPPTEEEIEQLLLELKYFSFVVKVVWMAFIVIYEDELFANHTIQSIWKFNYNRYIAVKEELLGMNQLGRPPSKHLTMQSCWDLPDLSLNLKDDQSDVFKLLAIIRPTWKKEKVHVKNLSGGVSCHMLRCTHEPGGSVTVRVRSNLEGIRDAAPEKQIVKVMSSKGYFSPLLATFQNGFCYEYIPGEPVYVKDSPVMGVDEEQLRLIAQEMANIHSVVVPGLDYTRSTHFDFLVDVLAGAKPCFEGCPTKEELIDEIRFVEEFVSEVRSPLVTIHGDPHAANMVWNKTQSKITYVDWEFSQVAHRAFDIAYFIHSFEFFVKKPHDIERKFCVHYLTQWNALSKKLSPTEEEIEQLLLESKYFSMVAKAVWMVFIFRFQEIASALRKFESVWEDHYNRFLAAKEELLGMKTLGRPPSKSEQSK